MSTAITKAIKALTKAQDERPTKCELQEILCLVASMKIEDSESESDSESDSESESESEYESADEESINPSDESSAEEELVAKQPTKRKYTKGPRAKGYELYLKNGGTRTKWSGKSDKYKDTYYDRHA